jgi:hypothetical protein
MKELVWWRGERRGVERGSGKKACETGQSSLGSYLS